MPRVELLTKVSAKSEVGTTRSVRVSTVSRTRIMNEARWRTAHAEQWLSAALGCPIDRLPTSPTGV
jgi:hypothetical protein